MTRRERFGVRLGGRAALVAAVVVGVAVRLLLVVTGSGTTRFTNADTSSYVGFARGLPSILWSPDQQGLIWSLQRTPGYPVVLWLLSAGGAVHLTWVVLVQCLVGGGLTVWLTHRLGGRCFGPVAAGTAAWLVALDPASVGHSLLVGTETVFTAALLVVLLGLERLVRTTERVAPGWVLAVGAGVGALALVRPVMLYAAPAVALVVGLAKRRGSASAVAVGMAALVLVGAAVPIGAWYARNPGVSGTALFSSAQGQNLFDIGAAAQAAEAGRMSIRPGDPGRGWADLDAATRVLRAQHAAELAPLDMGDPVVQDREWGRIGRAAILDHPRGYLTVVAQSLARTVTGPAHTLVVAQLPPSWQDGASPVVATGAVGWLGLEWALAAVGTVVAWRSRRRRALAVLLVPMAYYLFVSAGPQMYARFRVPVAPLVAILAGCGAVWLLERRRPSEPAERTGG